MLSAMIRIIYQNGVVEYEEYTSIRYRELLDGSLQYCTIHWVEIHPRLIVDVKIRETRHIDDTIMFW